MKVAPNASLVVSLALLGGVAVAAQQITDAEARMRSWEQHVRMEPDSPFR